MTQGERVPGGEDGAGDRAASDRVAGDMVAGDMVAGDGVAGDRAEGMAAIRVLLVDDQELIRRGLRKMLEIEDGIEVVGEAADGEDALRVAGKCRPDVALVDARMPRMDGVELIRRLSAGHPGVAALVLSTFDEDDYIFGALGGGAVGYLLKDRTPEELVDAVRRAGRGETVLAPPVAGRLVAELRRTPAVPRALPHKERLSARESDVARLVAAGAANREIAARLRITEGTVKNHVSSLLRKYGTPDRTRLALLLKETGGRSRTIT